MSRDTYPSCPEASTILAALRCAPAGTALTFHAHQPGTLFACAFALDDHEIPFSMRPITTTPDPHGQPIAVGTSTELTVTAGNIHIRVKQGV